MKATFAATALLAGTALAATELCHANDFIDSAIVEVMNKEMCSEQCPCPAEAKDMYTDFEGDLTFVESGRSFNTFQQCWTNVLSPSGAYSTDFVAEVDEYLAAMFELESQEGCSSICAPGNFWFTLPVTLEAPTDSCQPELQNGHHDLIVKLQETTTKARYNPYPSIIWMIKFINKGLGSIVFVLMIMDCMKAK